MSEKEEIGSVEGENNVTVPPIELASQKNVTENAESAKKAPRSKWVLPAIIAAAVLVLVGGGSYGYFAVYLQSPENLWKDGLANTHKGLESYVNAKQPLQSTGKISGTFTVTSPFGSDGKIEGSFDDKNAELTAEVGAVGVRPTFELRTITEEGAKSPDVYVKLSGTVPVGALVNNISPEAAGFINNIDNNGTLLTEQFLTRQKKKLLNSHYQKYSS